MNHRVTIRDSHGLAIGQAVLTTEHSQSSYHLPVLVVRPSDPYGLGRAVDQIGPYHIGEGVYGPADLPAGSVLHDAEANGTPQWWLAEDVRDRARAAGYTVADHL